jgi:hypothetical protein
MTDNAEGAVKWPHLVDGPDGYVRRSDNVVRFTYSGAVQDYTILSDTDTPSPLSSSERPIVWTQIRTLTLDCRPKPAIVYGCAHCDYVREKATGVMPHLGRHNRKALRSATKPVRSTVSTDLSLADALAGLGELDSLRTELAAVKGERDVLKRELAKIRRAFKSLGES